MKTKTRKKNANAKGISNEFINIPVSFSSIPVIVQESSYTACLQVEQSWWRRMEPV